MYEKHLKTTKLLNSIADFIYQIDQNFNFVSVFGKGIQNPGLEVNLVIGKNLKDVFSESVAKAHEVAGKLALNGASILFEWSLNVDGLIKSFQTHLTTIVDGEGKVSGYVCVGREKSEVNAFEKAHLEIEERYQKIIETSFDGISIISLEGKIKFSSYKMLEMFGYENANEVIGRDILEFVDRKDHEKALRTIDELIHGKDFIISRYTMVRKDGTRFDLEINAGLITDSQQMNKEIMVIHKDISEQIALSEQYKGNKAQFEKEISFSKSLLDYIINHNNSGVAVHDHHMNYIYVSHKYIEQFRLTDTSLIGKNHYDVFPDLPQKWRDIHKRVLNGEIISKDRDPFQRTDGTIDWTRWECRPWYDIEGKIGGIIVYTEVINEHLKIETLLEEKAKELFLQKSKMETTLHSIGDGVISTDNNCYVTFINNTAAKLIGRQESELIGAYFPDIFITVDDYTNELTDCLVDRVVKTQNNEFDHNLKLLALDGNEYFIENSASPIKDNNGEFVGVVLIIRNVTDRKLKEKQIEYLATHDSLTGLFNRRFMTEEVTRLDHEKNYPLGLIMVDINGLKIINEAYGYEYGDITIKKLAEVLELTCENKGKVGRIGGDEFAILLNNTNNLEIEMIKDQVVSAIEKININNIIPTVSIGISTRKSNTKKITEFINEAENNLYKNKFINGKSIRNNTIKAILKTLTDKYTNERVHSIRVSYFCREFALKLNLNADEVQELEMAGLFHDIGKISIPDAILDKPKRLTDQEFEIMKSHTENGYQILRAADQYSSLAEYALSHHERWDGLGYPNGLKGEQIPKFSRIICIVDSYEAMTTNRVYRKKLTNEEAIKELKRCAGTQYDPYLVEIFVSEVLNNHFDDIILDE